MNLFCKPSCLLFLKVIDTGFLFSDGRQHLETMPITFTLILDIKMASIVDDYLVSLANAKQSVIIGIRLGSKVSVDYRRTSGKLGTIKFDLHAEPLSGVEIALSVGQDNITLSINCWQRSVRQKPEDFPMLFETSGIISVWKKELPKVCSMTKYTFFYKKPSSRSINFLVFATF